jgi:hypothetical protein
MTRALAARRPMLPILHRVASDAPALTILAILLILSLIPLYAAMALDSRIFQDESPWMKPVKFHYALVVYTSTLAFFARYMPEATRTGRAWRWFTAAVVFAIMAEVAWLSAAAMLNTASHFNTDIPAFAAVYSLMGVLAVLLTSASLVMGISVWRNRATGLDPALQLAVALGLVLTFLLTVRCRWKRPSTPPRPRRGFRSSGSTPRPSARGECQARRRKLFRDDPAAERDRLAAHGPCLQQHAAGHPDPLAPDEGRRHALAAGDRPCRHRHPDGDRTRDGAAAGTSTAATMGREEVPGPRLAAEAEVARHIIGQLQRLGCSCDWDREAFTMSGAPGAPAGEEGNFHDAVIKVFVDMYNKGLIYRGKRLVNWDPHFETAISDLEVENTEVPATCGTSNTRSRAGRPMSMSRRTPTGT